MKKTFLGLGFFLLSLFGLFITVQASSYSNIKDEKVTSIVPSIEKAQLLDTQVQPKGVKTRFVKKTIKLVAKVLRNTSDDILRGVLKKRVEPKTVKKIINTKYEIADVLDDIVLPLDYVSSQIQTAIYDAMVPYVWHWVARGVAGLLELVSL